VKCAENLCKKAGRTNSGFKPCIHNKNLQACRVKMITFKIVNLAMTIITLVTSSFTRTTRTWIIKTWSMPHQSNKQWINPPLQIILKSSKPSKSTITTNRCKTIFHNKKRLKEQRNSNRKKQISFNQLIHLFKVKEIS
jgi:hypothetical protein